MQNTDFQAFAQIGVIWLTHHRPRVHALSAGYYAFDQATLQPAPAE